MIRVDADRSPIRCNVIPRFEIERDLIAGTPGSARHSPKAWGRGDAGLPRPVDDRQSAESARCRNVHLPSGAFGYSPSYTLGANDAAQLWAAAIEA